MATLQTGFRRVRINAHRNSDKWLFLRLKLVFFITSSILHSVLVHCFQAFSQFYNLARIL